MQETEISEMLLKNTELNIINSDLQKQLDELGKVRVLLLSNFYALAILWYSNLKYWKVSEELLHSYYALYIQNSLVTDNNDQTHFLEETLSLNLIVA